MIRVALVAVLASGCAVGGSSSVVGRWRARREIDSTVCMQRPAPEAGPGAQATDQSRPCDKLITIGRDLPARTFQSLSFTFPATGYMQQRGSDGYVGHGVAFKSHFEFIRGRGRYAIGGRIGALMGDGYDRRVFFTMPISVLAHVGGAWGSVYAGAGYSPVSLEQQYVGEGDMTTTLPPIYHHNGVHAFVGTRFWLRRTLERGLSFNPELHVEKFGDSTLTGVTGNIGLHF